MPATKNYYYILGLCRDATQPQIKHAYHQLVHEYHPDHNHSSNAEAQFKDITEAYSVLGDPEARARYDDMTKAIARQSEHSRRTPVRGFHLDIQVGNRRMSLRVGVVAPDSRR